MTSKVWASENSSGGEGATLFRQLTDAPSSYSGKSGLVARVRHDEAGLEFGVAMARTVRFVDYSNGDTTGGVLVGADLSAAPYYGNAAVGDALLLAGAATAADSGIWTITAIDAGVASIARRTDSQIGSLFVTGEPVFCAYDQTIHYIVVYSGGTEIVANATLDGDQIFIATSDVINCNFGNVFTALANGGIDVGNGAVGAAALKTGIVRIDASNSPYNTSAQQCGVLLIDANAGDVAVTIVGGPTMFDGTKNLITPLTLKRVDSASYTVTVTTQGSIPLDGGTGSFTLAAYEGKRLVYEEQTVAGVLARNWWTV